LIKKNNGIALQSQAEQNRYPNRQAEAHLQIYYNAEQLACQDYKILKGAIFL